jgi:hypothetical protein
MKQQMHSFSIHFIHTMLDIVSNDGYILCVFIWKIGFPSDRVEVGGEVHHAMSDYHKKMKSPMNLAKQGALSQFSEHGLSDGRTNNVHGIGHSKENITTNNVARSFTSGFSIGSWEDSNSNVFSTPANKTGIHNNDDIIDNISNSYELQVCYYLVL